MNHVRTQIRAALIALIGTVEGLSGRVVEDPTQIENAGDDPWIDVDIGQEQIQPLAHKSVFAGRALARQTQLFAEIHTRGNAEAVEKAEDLLALIEAKVFSDRRLGGLLLTPMTLLLVEPQPFDRTGSLPLRTLRVVWNSTYATAESDATAAAG